MNGNVKVELLEGELTEAVLAAFQVVVFCNVEDLDLVERVSRWCHASKVKFIAAESRGLFGNVFVDMGEKFIIKDVDGEERESYVVASVEASEVPGKTRVTIAESSRIDFQTGATVSLREFKGAGIEAINGTEWKAEVIGAHVVDFPFERSKYGAYQTGGIIQEVKLPKEVSFLSLEESLRKPGEFSIMNWSKMEAPAQSHIGWQALRRYRKVHGRYPLPGHEEDVQAFLGLVEQVNNERKAAGDFHVAELDKTLLVALADGASAEINPMAAYLGGMVAQEAVKSTGKFHPIFQWYYFDAVEAGPATGSIAAAQRQATGSRYDGQIALFGTDLQQRLQELKVFLVGAGALGCELLKNFACMGIGTHGPGFIQVTDLDTIEKSNLNRQFLFKPPDVSHPKSVRAAAAVKRMNPSLNIHAHETPVGKQTENLFDDNFWEPLDLVVNGLDNIQARLYVDERCVEFKKPLLESGTLGTKANAQVVLPHLTENYGASKDPPEKQIAVCTEKNFPFKIEHTIQWAKNLFLKTFFEIPTDVNMYLGDPSYIANMLEQNPSPNVQREKLEGITGHLDRIKRGVTFLDCITMARLDFEEQFSNLLKQLLHNFPADAKTSDGNAFWSPPKRPPIPVTFSDQEPLHLDYIVAAANLWAQIYGVTDRHRDHATIRKALSGIHVPPFKPKVVRIKEKDDDKVQEGAEDDDTAVKSLLAALPKPDWFKGRELHAQEFEKDVDSNHHIDFIAAAANLRARNYEITTVTRHQVKGIAGKIIPAVATTTCMITGLVCLELLKVVQKKPLTHFMNSFVNLAVPLAAFSEPLPPAKHTSDPAKNLRCVPENWTVWDTIDVNGDVTVQELITQFEHRYGCTVGAIASGQFQLYQPFYPIHKERLGKKVTELWKMVNKQESLPAGKNYIELVVLAEDKDNDEVEVDLPILRVFWKRPKDTH